MTWLLCAGRFVNPRTRENRRRGPDGRPLPEIMGEGLRLEPRVVNTSTASERTLEQVAAFDVTFSPAESVWWLWATMSDPAVREAIVAAPKPQSTPVSRTWKRTPGTPVRAVAGCAGWKRQGSSVARFRHRTARTTDPGRVGDPQLHTHCAILNRVKCVDGKWRTLDGATIRARPRSRRPVRGGARSGAVEGAGCVMANPQWAGADA